MFSNNGVFGVQFNITAMFLYLCFQLSFRLSYICYLTILAIDFINYIVFLCMFCSIFLYCNNFINLIYNSEANNEKRFIN